MKNIRKFVLGALAGAAMLCGSAAQASLTGFQTFVGNYGVSTDGWGSTTQAGTISADVPVGATVVAAYLYTSTTATSMAGIGGTLEGNAVSYTSLGTANGFLTAGRTDVTSILKPLIDGGPGGLYNFKITENNAVQDGEALVVVYQLASLTKSTVGILDGFTQSAGDSTSINFADPLSPTASGFFAEMRLGIGFSFDDAGCTGSQQVSTVKVNGASLTNNAGCNDDSADSTPSNGNLITVGGIGDGFSPANPTTAQDHERYNLVPLIADGVTTIKVDTRNASADDNIFLAVFHVAGEAGINAPPPPPSGPAAVPEPMSLALVMLALGGIGAQRRMKSRK